MKKHLLLALCSAFFLIGCTKAAPSIKTENLSVPLAKQNDLISELKKENKALSDELAQAKKDVHIARADNLIRLEIEKRLYHILRLMEEGNCEELKELVTSNAEASFSIAYEIHGDKSSNYENGIQVLYVGFKLVANEWKLDGMEVDVN